MYAQLIIIIIVTAIIRIIITYRTATRHLLIVEAYVIHASWVW